MLLMFLEVEGFSEGFDGTVCAGFVNRRSPVSIPAIGSILRWSSGRVVEDYRGE